ncbi:MAG: hypothetical protein ACYTFT_05720 [Planctomycetota bacterium]|jgi:hypothetical protein
MELKPYILGYQDLCARMVEPSADADPLRLDVLDPENLDFYRLINAGNRLAFGGLGMPAWVQLDCCTLPSAMIGFAARRQEIDAELWRGLVDYVVSGFGAAAGERLAAYDGWVPVSEYCAVQTMEPGTVTGFSLYTLCRGRGLGLRTKALALLCYGAQRQIGLTQYDNWAIRTHCRLGALHVLRPGAAPHSRPDNTFVYALDVPGPDLLRGLASGERARVETEPPTIEARVEGSRMPQRIAELEAEHGPLALVYPGLRKEAEEMALTLRPTAAA